MRVGFGTVVAAGSVLREDVTEDGRLVLAAPRRGLQREYRAYAYRNLAQVVRNNVLYLANLAALEAWYRYVRHPFFTRQGMGEFIYEAALEVLAQAKGERVGRLKEMAGKVPDSGPAGREFRERANDICAVFERGAPAPTALGETFLAALQAGASGGQGDYIQTIQGLGKDVSARGTQWLQDIVDGACAEVGGMLTAMDLFALSTQAGKP